MAEQNNDSNKDEFTVGFIGPISSSEKVNPIYTSEHWADILKIINDSIDIDKKIDVVSQSSDSDIIENRIVNNLYNKDLVICDVSSRNPNVMFELGLRLAFDKPVIMIIDDITPYSFDIHSIEHLNYPSNLNYTDIKDFQSKLKDRYTTIKKGNFKSYLNNFGNITPKKISTKEVDSSQIIIDKINQLDTRLSNITNKNNDTSSNRYQTVTIHKPKQEDDFVKIKHDNFSSNNPPLA